MIAAPPSRYHRLPWQVSTQAASAHRRVIRFRGEPARGPCRCEGRASQIEGLLVPVIKEAEKLPIEEISRVSRKLVSDARAGDLDVTSVEGGTFTISNLGMYGVDSFTPIINPPQIAVLGVGRIVDRPIATGGQLDVKPMISLCLTFDHRVVDGTEAAEFLKDIKHELEQEVH